MQEAFPYVLFAVVGLGVAAALVTWALSGKAYEEIGRGGLFEEDAPRGGAGGGGSTAERDAEIRDMLESRNRRRAAAGKPTVDVEAELARLTAPVLDAGLMVEIREHVEARNQRRIRRGHEPLDVEAEVARQVRELGG